MDAQWPSGQPVEGGTSYTATLKRPLSGNINLDVMTLKMTAGRDWNLFGNSLLLIIIRQVSLESEHSFLLSSPLGWIFRVIFAFIMCKQKVC